MSNAKSTEGFFSKLSSFFSTERDNLKDIIAKNPKDAVKILALPSFFSLFCLTLNGLVDSIFVAECGASSLIGVGVIQSLFVVVVGVGTGLSVAVNSYLSYTISKYSQIEKSRRIIYNAIILTLIMGIFISLFLILILKPLVISFNIGNALNPALTYGYVLFGGNIFFFFAAVIPAILRAEGEIIKSTYSLISTSLLNILLDYLLIHILGYGVFGAAIATVFCSALCCLLLIYFMGKSDAISLKVSEIIPSRDFSLMKKLFLDSLPVAFETGVISFFSLFANLLFNYFATEMEFAAFIAAYKLYNFAIIPIIALAEANVTIVSYLYGTKDFEAMKRLLKYELKLGMIISLILWIIITIFREPLAYMFSTSNVSGLIGPVSTAIPILNLMLIIMPLGLLSVSVLQGIQAFKESFIVSSVRSILLELFFGFIFAYILKSTYGIYLGFIIGAIMGCIISNLVMKFMIKKRSSDEQHV